MRASSVWFGLLLPLFTPACGGSTDGASAGGTGGSTGLGGAGSGGTAQQCEGVFQLCCDAQGNALSQICTGAGLTCPPGSSYQPGHPGSECPKPGQCTPTKPCASNEYCDYPDNACGSGQMGDCKPRPTACDKSYAPQCTCDGSVADNECSAYLAGSDLSAQGACAPPDGMFACGSSFCAKAGYYCLAEISDVSTIPDSFSCKPLPVSCGSAPACGCLANEPCGAECQASASGDLTLTCPGG
jgi:hypothetical protein